MTWWKTSSGNQWINSEHVPSVSVGQIDADPSRWGLFVTVQSSQLQLAGEWPTQAAVQVAAERLVQGFDPAELA